MVKDFIIGKWMWFGNKCLYVFNLSCCSWKLNL